MVGGKSVFKNGLNVKKRIDIDGNRRRDSGGHYADRSKPAAQGVRSRVFTLFDAVDFGKTSRGAVKGVGMPEMRSAGFCD